MERRTFLWSAGSLALLQACGDSAGESPDGGGRGADAGPGGADARANRVDADPTAADAAATCEPTRSDALGPFFEEGAPMRARIADDAEPGERLTLMGTVLTTDCVTPVPGVLIDVWQADRDGVYHAAGKEYRLRGQVLTDSKGRFAIETVRPGSYEIAPGSRRPAHVHLMFAKPGFASFPTQIYFAGDPFLPPNDGCATCGSDDAERIVELAGNPANGWNGAVRIVLART